MSVKKEQKQPKTNNITVLGIGGAGGKIVHYLQKQGVNCRLLYTDTDEKSLLESDVETLKLYSNGKADFSELMEKLKDTEKLIVVTGLGGKSGNIEPAIITVISTLLKLNSRFIVTMPAKFEGKKINAAASKDLEILETFTSKLDLPLDVFYFDDLISSLDENTRLCDCFGIMNEKIYQRIKKYTQ